MYRNILEKPLTAVELNKLADLGSTSVKELLNPKSTGFKELKLDLAQINDPEAAKLINQYPKIMRRPILSDKVRVTIGFDPNQYSEMIG